MKRPGKMPTSTQTQVLLILFPGFNTLDMNGPYDVFTKSGTSQYFSVTIAAEDDITKSFEGVLVQRNIPLDDELVASVATGYDVLVVPGGAGTYVYAKAAQTSSPFMKLIGAFAQSPARSKMQPRLLMSVCTGAFFPAALGIFDGRFCTTHWENYTELVVCVQDAAARTQSQAGTVIPARFVDSGLNEAGVRIVSSGGISCGMDASLHVVKILYGEEEATSVAGLLDYTWRKTEGVVFGESFGG